MRQRYIVLWKFDLNDEVTFEGDVTASCELEAVRTFQKLFPQHVTVGVCLPAAR